MSAKILGIVTAPSVNGTDYQLTKITAKVEQEKIEYVPMGATQGWKTTLPGGAKVITGSFEGAADSAGLGAGMAPFTDGSTVTISIGDVGLSFAAVIQDLEVDKSNTGLVTIKANFQSSGVVSGVS